MLEDLEARRYLGQHVDGFIKSIAKSTYRKIPLIEMLKQWEKYSARNIALTLKYRLLFLSMVEEKYKEVDTVPSILTYSNVKIKTGHSIIY